MLVGGLFLYWVARLAPPGYPRAFVHGMLGVVLCGIVYFILKKSLWELLLPPVKIGSLKNFVIGLVFGLLLSFASGMFYGLIYETPLAMNQLSYNLPMRVLSNAYPALSEEIVFRGGIVHATTAMFGRLPGLAAGSIPFGLLHVINILLGQVVTLGQIVGVCLAGLMLGLVYIRFGLTGAVGAHWAWNFMLGGWLRTLQLPLGTSSYFEGAWSTCLVLGIACAGLSLSLWKRRHENVDLLNNGLIT